jgi:hypothetical protein
MYYSWLVGITVFQNFKTKGKTVPGPWWRRAKVFMMLMLKIYPS